MGLMLEHIHFDRIDFEALTLYDLQEAVDGENDDLNGQTFSEARATQNALVERILNAVFSITDKPF